MADSDVERQSRPGGARQEDEAIEIRRVLEDVRAGMLEVDEALTLLRLLQVAHLQNFARLDLGRALRKGIPEVIYAPHKTERAFLAIIRHLLDENGLALATRVEPHKALAVRQAVTATATPAGPPVSPATEETAISRPHVDYDADSGILEIAASWYRRPQNEGRVGILTAGTSDMPVAEEAALVVRHMGCEAHKAYDVGTAGIHRLLEPLADMMGADVHVFVVAAGMEGALPSLVAGLVDVPVIGVPTSTGYGVGGDGTAALYSVLQSCSPGLVAVNVDNGVGAGAAAALIARGASRK